jgi:hypothetical protein
MTAEECIRYLAHIATGLAYSWLTHYLFALDQSCNRRSTTMNDKVAGVILAAMALFFGYEGLDQASINHTGGALVGVLFAAILIACSAFALAQARPIKGVR